MVTKFQRLHCQFAVICCHAKQLQLEGAADSVLGTRPVFDAVNEHPYIPGLSVRTRLYLR